HRGDREAGREDDGEQQRPLRPEPVARQRIAHSTADTIVTMVAPPHSSKELPNGRNVVSTLRIAAKLSTLHRAGHSTLSPASALKAASTTHSNGITKATPITTIATEDATWVRRARGPECSLMPSPPPAAVAGTPTTPAHRSPGAPVPPRCRSRAGRTRRPART